MIFLHKNPDDKVVNSPYFNLHNQNTPNKMPRVIFLKFDKMTLNSFGKINMESPKDFEQE